MTDHETTYLETSCALCSIKVSAWGGEPEWRSVYVTVLSEHLAVERWRWLGRNGRLRTAWRVLSRGWRDPTFEFNTAQELDRFLDALTKAHAVAFGGTIGILRQPEILPWASGEKRT